MKNKRFKHCTKPAPLRKLETSVNSILALIISHRGSVCLLSNGMVGEGGTVSEKCHVVQTFGVNENSESLVVMAGGLKRRVKQAG